VLRTNAKVAEAISIDELEGEDVNFFIYLGATIHKAGGSREDIKHRLSIEEEEGHIPLSILSEDQRCTASTLT